MSIAVAPGRLRWRVVLPAARDTVWELLATDSGREHFWAESSRQDGDHIELRFADGTSASVDLLHVTRPASIGMRYFGTRTTFELVAVTPTRTVLEVEARDVGPDEALDVAGGWVSVLLCLKAYLAAGIDLRNHAAPHSWREGFVDN